MHSLPHYQYPHQSDTFVITDEFALTHHYHGLRFTLGFTLGVCTFYGFG